MKRLVISVENDNIVMLLGPINICKKSHIHTCIKGINGNKRYGFSNHLIFHNNRFKQQ